VIATHALDANAAGRTHRYDSMPPLRERLAASHAATALSTLFRYRARSRPDPDANVSLRPTTYFGEPFAAAQTSSIDSTTAARNSARPRGSGVNIVRLIGRPLRSIGSLRCAGLADP
jgi:hypothetical protein